MSRIPNVSLSNGVLMPAAVFGVYQIRDLKECQKAVEDAIAAGYRAIDTAASYGNEAAVGHAIKACGLDRRELFITTKLGWRMQAKKVRAEPLTALSTCSVSITSTFI